MDRAKQGDRRAFDELVRRYRKRVLALTLHLTGNASDAEDVTQEVFLGAYRALPRFEGRSHFFTWVYRMAVNKSHNARRSRQRRRETPMEDPRIDRAIAVDAPNNPLRAAELRELYARLLIALDKLAPAIKTTVVLVALQGLSHAEASVVQGCAPGTIAWRMHEARKHLRRALDRRPRRFAIRAPRSTLSAGLGRLLTELKLPVPEPA